MMKNFREGSNVKWNGKKDSKSGEYWNNKEKFLKSKEVHTIELISRWNCTLEGYDCTLFDLKLFDLVEEPKFKTDEEVEVSNDGDFWIKKKFYSFDKTLYYPYIVKKILGTGKSYVTSFKYCRKVQPKYKAYTEPKLEWLDLSLQDESGDFHRISSVGKDHIEFDESDSEPIFFKEMLNYTLDGKPFGEEIK